MSQEHTPNPEFVDSLEWELKSAMRRQGTLNGSLTAMRPAKSRWVSTVALVLVSVLVGGAGTYATLRSFDEEAAALHIARAEARLEIARTRLEPLARARSKTQSLFHQGVAPERELRQVEAAVLHAQSTAARRELELDETHITGRGPDDALSAPWVGRRDFVTERLAVQLVPLGQRLELFVDQARHYQELFDAGAISEAESKAVETVVVAAEQELTELQERIALRASFLAGELSATEVELRGMRLAAVAAREKAARHVEVLGVQHDWLKDLVERGAVSSSEYQETASAWRAAKADVGLAELELRILDQRLEAAQER